MPTRMRAFLRAVEQLRALSLHDVLHPSEPYVADIGYHVGYQWEGTPDGTEESDWDDL